MKNSKLHNINKAGFKTPDHYFESFEEKVLNKLQDNNTLKNIKSSGFKIPNDYFETLDDNIPNHIKNKKTKVIPLHLWKKAAYISAVAASVILTLNTVFNTSKTINFNSLEIASIENYLIEESTSSYELVTLLDDDFILEPNDLDTYYNDENIEDFLMNNIDVEDLESLLKE